MFHCPPCRIALSVSLLCLAPFSMAEDSLLKPVDAAARVTAAAEAVVPMSAEEMKAAGERATKAAEKLGWRIGCQAWTFNSRTLYATIDQVNALGLHYIEAIPGQVIDTDKNVKMGPGMSQEVKDALKKKLADADKIGRAHV